MSDSLLVILEKDPGNPVFVEAAAYARASGDNKNAREILLRGLSNSPGNNEGRLLLAKYLYLDGFLPFAIQEIEILKNNLPGNEAINRLYESLSPDTSKSSAKSPHTGSATVAEVQFSFEDLDLLNDDDKNNS